MLLLAGPRLQARTTQAAADVLRRSWVLPGRVDPAVPARASGPAASVAACT